MSYNILILKYWTRVQNIMRYSEPEFTILLRNVEPPIKYWTGIQNIMAAKDWTHFRILIFHSHWKGSSKHYGCKRLNSLLIFHFHWKGGLKYYACGIFRTSCPMGTGNRRGGSIFCNHYKYLKPPLQYGNWK